MNVMSIAHEVISKVKTAIAPSDREVVKREVFKYVNGEELDERALAKLPFTEGALEWFKKHGEIAKGRQQAAKDMIVTPEEKKQVAQSQAVAAELQRKADAAAAAANAAIAEFQQAQSARQQLSSRINQRVSGAMSYLSSTADMETYHATMGSETVQGPRNSLNQKRAKLEKTPQELQRAEEALDDITRRLAVLENRTDVDSVTERTFARAQLAACKGHVADLKARLKLLDEVDAELAKIDAQADKFGQKLYEPEFMAFDFSPTPQRSLARPYRGGN